MNDTAAPPTTPPTPTGTPTGGGGQQRITVSMLPKAMAALDEVHALTGETRTDCVNRAVQFYAMAHQAQSAGGCLYIRDTRNAELERLRVL